MTQRDEEEIPPPSPELLLALRVIPKVGDALATYVVERHQRRLARAGEVISSAAQLTGKEPEQFVQDVSQNERSLDLLHDVIEASARSRLETKRQALARVLARALEGDDASMDDAEMLLATLAHLEPVHIRVMAGMFSVVGGRRHAFPLKETSIAHKATLEGSVVEAALLQLQAWGVVSSEMDLQRVLERRSEGRGAPWDYDPNFSLTRHGLAIADLLEEPEQDET
ncbi:MAG: hypothetical protein M3N53_00055 [Actinomycetota bacterium]|nr:hypothetical protein [Actinomycetota bacterium]